MSAQEAAAFLLGFANTKCSRDVIYVSTSPPEERVRMLKPKEEQEQLEEGSNDILAKGLIEHYVQRSDDLEDVCLADFATWYEYEKTKNDNSTDLEQNMDPQPGPSRLMYSQTQSNPRKKPRFNLKDGSGRMRLRTVQKILRFRRYGKADDTGNFWREQLMLFVPWRNENELRNETAKHLAEENIKLINENSKSYYFDKSWDEDEMERLVRDAEDEEEEDMDPCVENDMVFLDGEEEEEYVESELMRSKASKKFESFRPPNQIDDASYRELMRSLNEKQRRFVLTVLHKLKTSEEPFYYFLSGGAGVGKSRVVTAIIQTFLRYEDPSSVKSPDDICVLVSAPTGKAAFNVFGMTLHSTFSLPPTQSAGKAKPLEASKLNTLRMKLQHVKLFIIDEVSMVSVRQLYDIDARLQQVFGCEKDFGGKPLIVVGHLRQLPPVMGSYAFLPPKHLTQAAEAVDNPLWSNFELFELDQIMRQKGEEMFCKALNNMSEGVMDEDDITLIRSRKITMEIQPPDGVIWLFATTAACLEHNKKIHSILQTEGAMATAHDKIQGAGKEDQKKNLLDYAKRLDQQKSDGLPYETFLKVGAVYFVSTNVDVQDGLFNGATGILRRIEYSRAANNKMIPRYAWMEFEDSLIGAKARLETRSYQLTHNIPEGLVRISRVKRNLSAARGKTMEIIRQQIPLVAANGMTIHKSQGSSMQNVVVSVKGLKPTMLNYRELIYVACSRATSPGGLFIDGDFLPPRPPKQNDHVSNAMADLRSKMMDFPFQFLQDFEDIYERFFYQNVHSLMGKVEDVTSDQSAMAATLLAFVEPWLAEQDIVSIPGFKVIHKSYCPSGRPRNSEGMVLFGKRPGVTSPTYQKEYGERGGHSQFLSYNTEDIQIVVMYRHKDYSKTKFLFLLENLLKQNFNRKTLFIGDININLMSHDGIRLIDLFSKYNYESKIDVNASTSDFKSHIDCCFSNYDEVIAWIYESYFSDHKPICVVWPKKS